MTQEQLIAVKVRLDTAVAAVVSALAVSEMNGRHGAEMAHYINDAAFMLRKALDICNEQLEMVAPETK